MRIFVLGAVLLSVGLAGCESTKQIETVAVAAEVARTPISQTCHTEGLEKFKGVAKAKTKDATPPEALVHALQSNKSRMTRNEERVLQCECAQAQESQNPDDLKRLGAKCDPFKPKSEAAKPPEGKAPAPATSTAPPAPPRPKLPKLPEAT